MQFQLQFIHIQEQSTMNDVFLSRGTHSSQGSALEMVQPTFGMELPILISPINNIIQRPDFYSRHFFVETPFPGGSSFLQVDN